MEIPTYQNCQFYEPVYWDSATESLLLLNGDITKFENWNFSKFSCESTTTDNTFILIKNDETGAEFYIDKTLNYGEAMILWFLTIFAFYLIFKTAYGFFWKK